MPKRMNTAADVWGSVAVGGADECWLWGKSVSSGGYGQFYFDGRLHTAHRVTYELAKGPIPSGLQIDHLCRNKRCCNPSHLEAVTGLENVRRAPDWKGNKTACPQGHPYAGTNLYIRPSDEARICVTCNRTSARARKADRRASFNAQGLTSRGTQPFYRPQSGQDGGPGCPGTTGNARLNHPDAAPKGSATT